MRKHVLMVGLFIGLVGGDAPFAPFGAPDHTAQGGGQVVLALNRPDLVLEKIWTTEMDAEPGRKKVIILYTIFNDSSAASSCCPTEEGKKAWQQNPINNMLFYCSVESRVLPGGRFNKLPDHQGGVWITSLKPYERQTQRWAYEILPVGSQREYRVRIDPMNWIWEKKEDNNEGTSIWPATRTH